MKTCYIIFGDLDMARYFLSLIYCKRSNIRIVCGAFRRLYSKFKKDPKGKFGWVEHEGVLYK